MSDRTYLFVVGLYILAALYMDIDQMIYALVAVMFFEGITDLTLTSFTQKILKVRLDSGLLEYESIPRFRFEAIRALRVFFSIAMAASYMAVYEYDIDVLWFLPWFFGFALVGAGVSGVCPVVLGMRWLGFR